jgi:hypothetical protein
MRIGRTVAAMGATAMLLAPVSVPPVVQASNAGSRLASETLTPGPERYVVRTGAAGEVTVRARAPVVQPLAWNRREILVAPGAVASRDQQVCATWTHQSRDLDQEGLAVRSRVDSSGHRQAVTLTKNTYANFVWVFNLLTWDTGRRGVPWRLLGQFDLHAVVSPDGRLARFPWRVCLRAHGRRVDFKVWLAGREPEPPWSDGLHARSTSVSSRFVRAGVPGWYVGHLQPGDTVTYADLTSADDANP